MSIHYLKECLIDGTYSDRRAELYGVDAVQAQTTRYLRALEGYQAAFGDSDQDVAIYSAPGRAEISGNHTDHQRGKIIAAAVNVDIIAVVSKSCSGIQMLSEEYGSVTIGAASGYEEGTTESLVIGVMDYFKENGYEAGGFNAYVTSEVQKGSGLSSSAAFEILVGTILNYEYNGGRLPATQLAKAGKYAENNFFGKPSGLMDQAASALGGFVYIDFSGEPPVVERIAFRPEEYGFIMCVVHTGGSHAGLTEEYAAIPGEMRAVARLLGHEVLGDCDEDELFFRLSELRQKAGDRAVLRAMHFFCENKRVEEQAELLKNGDHRHFLELVKESGRSSLTYLQNIYAPSMSAEQPITLSLALAERVLEGKGAFRVHGGGFAGTILAFVPVGLFEAFKSSQDAVFGKNACQHLTVRQNGAVKVF